MPIYAYRCESCGLQFEQQQSFDDPPIRVCPECGEGAVRKLYQPVGIVFKGPGFYVTDNRRSSSTTGSSRKSEGDKAEAKKDSSSSDD